MDMSSKPEGATHYSESFDRWYKLDVSGEWFFWLGGERWETSNDLNGGDGVPDLTSLHPPLETMLTEWRDLEARAQAAQAEADALFEHAGQCHGEIVVRLAELGWGAPRGKPVVTLDEPEVFVALSEDWWKHVKVGDMLTYHAGDGGCHMGKYFTDGQSYKVFSVDNDEDAHYPWEVWSDSPDTYYWGSPDYFTPSTQP
jgi:hypothetical protein